VMNALVQPLIATCLHRQVIDPHVACPFIAGDHELRGRHVEWVVRGLAGDVASGRPRGPSQHKGRRPTSDHSD
jgi:hypothetical protein